MKTEKIKRYVLLLFSALFWAGWWALLLSLFFVSTWPVAVVCWLIYLNTWLAQLGLKFQLSAAQTKISMLEAVVEVQSHRIADISATLQDAFNPPQPTIH
jgi:hypothetical protein